MIKLTKDEYLERIKNKQSVSRLDFKLDFKWNDCRDEFLKIIKDLSSADLQDADLQDADLRSADLRNADLQDADLSFADLQDADLSFADLRSADLSFAKETFIFNFGVKLKILK